MTGILPGVTDVEITQIEGRYGINLPVHRWFPVDLSGPFLDEEQ